MTPGIADFLLACIAEDEDEARRAAFGYGSGWTSVSDDVDGWSTVHADDKRDMVGCEDRDVTRHIARHDPANVLAECDAKRRIVQWCDDRTDRIADEEPNPHDVLRLLALPYADHPDYCEEWRP